MMERRRVTLDCDPDTGKTKQSFKEDADINVLVERWKHGVPIPEQTSPGMYGDFSEVGTFYEAQNMVFDANEHFLALPAKVRSRFDHDAGKMIEFMTNPDNEEEAAEMGLVPPVLKESADPPVPGEAGISGGESPPEEGSETS